MTALSLAVRNLLAEDPDIRRLVGRSTNWGTWVFDEKPLGAKFESNSTCLIVVNEGEPWTDPNEHNTMKFPTIIVDIWADPTRNEDRSTKIPDATEKIETIQDVVDRHLHLVDAADLQGYPRVWGTAEQIASRTGVVITGSVRRSGPEYSPIRDADDAWMGRLVYGVNKP